MAATRRLAGPSLILSSYDISKSKFRNVGGIVRHGEHPAATHLHLGRGQFELMLQSR